MARRPTPPMPEKPIEPTYTEIEAANRKAEVATTYRQELDWTIERAKNDVAKFVAKVAEDPMQALKWDSDRMVEAHVKAVYVEKVANYADRLIADGDNLNPAWVNLTTALQEGIDDLTNELTDRACWNVHSTCPWTNAIAGAESVGKRDLLRDLKSSARALAADLALIDKRTTH